MVQRYTAFFQQVDTDRDGKVSGGECVPVFAQWGLPKNQLKQLWDLVDLDTDGFLRLPEFAAALFLMDRFKDGQPLPNAYPHSLFPPTWPQVGPGASPHTSSLPRTAISIPEMPARASVAVAGPLEYNSRVPSVPEATLSAAPASDRERYQEMHGQATKLDEQVQKAEHDAAASRQAEAALKTAMQQIVLFKSQCTSRSLEASSKAESLQREVAALESQYNQAYQTAEASKTQLQEAAGRISALEEKRDQLQGSLAELQANANPAEKERELQNDISALENTLQQMHADPGLQHVAQLQQRKIELEGTIAQLDAQKRETQTLPAQIDQLNQQVQALEADKPQRHDTVEALVKSVEEISAKLSPIAQGLGVEMASSGPPPASQWDGVELEDVDDFEDEGFVVVDTQADFGGSLGFTDGGFGAKQSHSFDGAFEAFPTTEDFGSKTPSSSGAPSTTGTSTNFGFSAFDGDSGGAFEPISSASDKQPALGSDGGLGSFGGTTASSNEGEGKGFASGFNQASDFGGSALGDAFADLSFGEQQKPTSVGATNSIGSTPLQQDDFFSQPASGLNVGQTTSIGSSSSSQTATGNPGNALSFDTGPTAFGGEVSNVRLMSSYASPADRHGMQCPRESVDACLQDAFGGVPSGAKESVPPFQADSAFGSAPPSSNASNANEAGFGAFGDFDAFS